MSPALKPNLRGAALLRAIWRLGRSYWTSREARIGALLLFVTIVLEFLTVYANLLIADYQRQVVEGLEHRQTSDFIQAGALYIVVLLGFVAASTLRIYVRQVLEIRWRRDLTSQFVGRWISPRAFAQSQLHQDLDNPDQRISEDIRDFVASALGLSLSLLSALATLVSFGGVLWTLSSAWKIPVDGQMIQLPGLLFWVAVAAAFVSIVAAHLMGRRLVPINFDRFRFEANFRYGLVRYRDHVKEVGLNRGELVERRGADGRFHDVYDVFLRLVRAERDLTLVTGSIGQLNGLLPLLLAAPAYFGGMLTLGMIVQARTAYDQVSGALLWFVNAYREIARWRANVERLDAFEVAIDDTARVFEGAGVCVVPAADGVLRLENVRLEAPIGQPILSGINATVRAGERVALVGAVGKGKSTLLRAIAGIWPFGSGRIEQPIDGAMLFVPQLPYLPIGTLRAAFCYPREEGCFSDERIREVLAELDLSHLGARIDECTAWDDALSGLEKQLLALARALLHEPRWIFMDDAMSGIDAETERRLYEILFARLPDSTLVALGTGAGVLDLFSTRWTLRPVGDGTATLQAA